MTASITFHLLNQSSSSISPNSIRSFYLFQSSSFLKNLFPFHILPFLKIFKIIPYARFLDVINYVSTTYDPFLTPLWYGLDTALVPNPNP